MKAINLNKYDSRQKILIISALFVVVSTAIVYFIIAKTAYKIKYLNKEIIEQRVDFYRKLNREDNLARLNDKLKQIEPSLNKLNKIFIDSNKKLEFITTLEDVAQKNGVSQEITLSDQGEAGSGNSSQKHLLGMEVRGSFNDVVGYLADLENMDYYINIFDIDLSSSNRIAGGSSLLKAPGIDENDSGGGPSLIMKISAYTYWK